MSGERGLQQRNPNRRGFRRQGSEPRQVQPPAGPLPNYVGFSFSGSDSGGKGLRLVAVRSFLSAEQSEHGTAPFKTSLDILGSMGLVRVEQNRVFLELILKPLPF